MRIRALGSQTTRHNSNSHRNSRHGFNNQNYYYNNNSSSYLFNSNYSEKEYSAPEKYGSLASRRKSSLNLHKYQPVFKIPLGKLKEAHSKEDIQKLNEFSDRFTLNHCSSVFSERSSSLPHLNLKLASEKNNKSNLSQLSDRSRQVSTILRSRSQNMKLNSKNMRMSNSNFSKKIMPMFKKKLSKVERVGEIKSI